VPRRRAPVRRSPDIHGGQPVFAGTTVPIQTLADHLRGGGDVASYLDRWPALPPERVRDVLVFALEELIARERVPAGPPQASLLPRTDERGAIINAADLTAAVVVGKRVLCPACRELRFRSWPEGWDSHAAHRCSGIVAVEPRARKAEFKRRYGHLFRSER
jgi:uncharacterized protein (DUF433 family)